MKSSSSLNGCLLQRKRHARTLGHLLGPTVTHYRPHLVHQQQEYTAASQQQQQGLYAAKHYVATSHTQTVHSYGSHTQKNYVAQSSSKAATHYAKAEQTQPPPSQSPSLQTCDNVRHRASVQQICIISTLTMNRFLHLSDHIWTGFRRNRKSN